MIRNLSEEHSLISNWVSELRDIQVHSDRLRFRRNLERIGEVAAYEISKELAWVTREVQTPLGVHSSKVLKEQPVIATILRAGLAMHQGVLNYFDKADNTFVSAYRKHNEDGSFDIVLDYVSSPSIQDRILIISDPMLATGTSLAKTIKALEHLGKPAKTYIIAAIASKQGIDYLESSIGEQLNLWCGDIDDQLDDNGYIVPGLGDAGDLAFGEKLQH
ncbi:uracil phosphoribosyltransferase [Arachidicoccus ginsenosidivorans]|jgi:uracil phosphoribosyltransferase|uniref:Uracil phosphoribosyltransferase n=1 Tax=Arachidicoccus ginsenosidivorans TaxID=496057 RepID=A0A5B8VJ33_9BACT|nr:uracil phosphoribosyltransferase [Arachidicoccus ginsenosidivorans]QEC71319.1 uracil phosphoribosyltransferase [Arachidicoccus ginsenosidivorans]